MLPELKQKWINALRSGEFRQGQGELRYDMYISGDYSTAHQAYCCLGVLREIVNPTDFESENADNNYLSPEQLERYGLTGEEQQILAELNDDKNMSFDEIATYIEKTDL